jgi:molecular chaperone GrpE
VKIIDSKGKKFDPFYHEVISTEEGDGEDGTIIEVYKKGYLLYDSLLKPAKVKVLKKR